MVVVTGKPASVTDKGQNSNGKLSALRWSIARRCTGPRTAGVCCPRAAALPSCTRWGGHLRALGPKNVSKSKVGCLPFCSPKSWAGRGVSVQRGAGEAWHPLESRKAAATGNWVNPLGPPADPARCRQGQGRGSPYCPRPLQRHSTGMALNLGAE